MSDTVKNVTSNIAGSNINMGVGTTATTHALLILQDIPGPITSTAKELTDPAFQLVWYQFNIMHEAVTAVAGVHQGSGRIAQSPFRVALLDHQTTGIFNAFTKGTIIPVVKVALTQRMGQTIERLFVVELKQVRIASFHQMQWSEIEKRKENLPFVSTLDLSGAPHFQGSTILELHLVPEEIKVEYTPAGTDGTISGSIAQNYNSKTQAVS